MTYELKKLADKNLGAAITLAKHYRDLNQPDEAESICRDVLEVAPDDVDALRTLGLTLTDRFPTAWMSLFEEACSTFKKLPSEYTARPACEEAIVKFEEASALAAKDDPAPILHYNRCVRALTTNPEIARASTVPQQPKYEFGD
jgi:tetratricopeptide (TPR) repeat protein